MDSFYFACIPQWPSVRTIYFSFTAFPDNSLSLWEKNESDIIRNGMPILPQPRLWRYMNVTAIYSVQVKRTKEIVNRISVLDNIIISVKVKQKPRILKLEKSVKVNKHHYCSQGLNFSKCKTKFLSTLLQTQLQILFFLSPKVLTLNEPSMTASYYRSIKKSKVRTKNSIQVNSFPT